MKALLGLIKKTLLLPWRLLTWFRQILANLLLLVFIGVIASAFIAKEKPTAKPENGALLINPTGVLVEQRSYMDPMNLLFMDEDEPDAETSLHDLTLAIRQAAKDDHITGLVIDGGWLQGADPSKLQTVGDAIAFFKKTSEKPVIAVGDHYTQAQYFLASYADEILLNPMGDVFLTGFGVYPSFYKEALDKLKITVHIFRVGDYKSFVEPFVRNDMSEQSKQNTGLWLNGIWQSFAASIEQQRNLDVGAVNNYINHRDYHVGLAKGNAAQAALQAGLIDKIATRDEIKKYLIEAVGANKAGDSFAQVEWKPYAKKRKAMQSAYGDKVGVIIAKGAIMDGKQDAGNIGGDTLATQIETARQDRHLKALVLRIDSPGGSAFASEIIRRELELTQQAGIPVIASFGGVAASGGYWIAATADEIWSTPTTITGSIGVFGMMPTLDQSFAALGIHSDGVGTTDLADAWHLDRPMNPILENSVQQEVEHTYKRFISLVAQGRKSSAPKIHTVAQGQVWSGMAAKKRGLVDHLGDLDQAIASAAKLGGLGENYQWEFIEPELSAKEQLIQEITEQFSGALVWAKPLTTSWLNLKNPLSTLMLTMQKQIQALATYTNPQGIYVRCVECQIR